jgi:two-component system, chemotaxis family, protein-glutamate methylesterase/glutaminase
MHAEPHTRGVDTPVACRAVAIGASAGGIRALQTVLRALPSDFAVPVLVVLHLDRRHKSLLASVLGPHTSLRVKPAEIDEALGGGTVYLGVPDFHLEVVDEHVALAATAAVNFSRPSVDVLFRSMAAAYGPTACVVVLSGAGRDGADGLAATKAAGGTTIVQDPATAGHDGMPLAALATRCVDMTLALEAIGPALVRCVMAS